MVQINEETKGILIGKFMPPHKGHKYLVDFAKNYVDRLFVLVCSIESEPIPGELRYNWMKEEFPEVCVRQVTDENPQYPDENPDFWNIWCNTIKKAVPEGADYLFASERYGEKLASMLEMKFIPATLTRNTIPISGTEIRNNPMKNWDFLLEAARPYFAKRICIFGPESTGKSTLSKKLASRFNTVYVREWARDYLDLKDGKCTYEDIEVIAKGQLASEDALAKQANKILVCDTDLITTVIWSDILFKKCPEWIKEEAEKRSYDLYILLDDDVPFVKDKQRYGKDKRQLSVERCIQELEKRKKPYVLINGSWKERFEKAADEIKKLVE